MVAARLELADSVYLGKGYKLPDFNQFVYATICYRQSSTIALYNDVLQNIFYIFTQNTRCRECRRRNLIVQIDCHTTNLCQRESNQQLPYLPSSWCYHLSSLSTLTSRLVQAGVEPTLLCQVTLSECYCTTLVFPSCQTFVGLYFCQWIYASHPSRNIYLIGIWYSLSDSNWH